MIVFQLQTYLIYRCLFYPHLQNTTMRIDKISVRQYRKLQDVTVVFDHTIGESSLLDIYGKLGISLFAGPNGSGKTSLLSFVGQIFHRLEREPEQLPSFEIDYSFEDKNGKRLECRLSKESDEFGVRLTVDGVVQGIIRRNDRGNPVRRSGSIDYDAVKKYLPVNIIISAFSLHGEYPFPRSDNWIGDRRLNIFDTKNLYGTNHYSFPSFSRAIRKLLELKNSGNSAIATLERLLAGQFTGRVKIAEREIGSEANWVDFSDDVAFQEKDEQIYINDFELQSGGNLLTLGNMSSGQKMLFIRLLSILDTIQDNSIVIIEEPEIHLDLNWSRQIISILLAFFSTYKAHLLIATHSFSLLNSVPNNWIFLSKNGNFSPPPKPILLGNESVITNEIFAPMPHAIENQILSFAANATIEQLEKLFSTLGESGAKYAVFQNLIKKKK